MLEGCRHHGCGHLVYASSSVYSANTKLPFSVNDKTDHPISLYAATKKANELLAHSLRNPSPAEMTARSTSVSASRPSSLLISR